VEFFKGFWLIRPYGCLGKRRKFSHENSAQFKSPSYLRGLSDARVVVVLIKVLRPLQNLFII